MFHVVTALSYNLVIYYLDVISVTQNVATAIAAVFILWSRTKPLARYYWYTPDSAGDLVPKM